MKNIISARHYSRFEFKSAQRGLHARKLSLLSLNSLPRTQSSRYPLQSNPTLPQIWKDLAIAPRKGRPWGKPLLSSNPKLFSSQDCEEQKLWPIILKSTNVLVQTFLCHRDFTRKEAPGQAMAIGQWKVPGTYFLGYLRSLPWENEPKRLTLTTPLHASNWNLFRGGSK